MDVPMTVMTCSCGATYALPDRFIEERREDHNTFYCPNGCSRHYPHKNDAEIAREEAARCCREADSLRQQLEYEEENARHLERSRRSTRGQVTRLQKKLETATQ